MPTAFPLLPLYTLLPTNAKATSDSLRTVRFERSLVREHPPYPDGDLASCDPQASLRRWLCACGSKQTAIACNLEFDHRQRWQGVSPLRLLVRKDQRAIDAAFAAMLTELERARVLLRGDVTLARRIGAHVTVDLVDDRGNRRDALPSPDELLLAARTVPRPSLQ